MDYQTQSTDRATIHQLSRGSNSQTIVIPSEFLQHSGVGEDINRLQEGMSGVGAVLMAKEADLSFDGFNKEAKQQSAQYLAARSALLSNRKSAPCPRSKAIMMRCIRRALPMTAMLRCEPSNGDGRDRYRCRRC